MIELKAKSAQIIYNETVRKLSTTTETVGLNNDNAIGDVAYSIGKNQFIRAESTVGDVENAPTVLYSHTLMAYSKGKETAKIRCSIGEYYDEGNNIVISTKNPTRMIFSHYDRVVPMVRKSHGTDEPLSLTAEGKAKVFEVVGVRIFYDGAVWQELTLVECGEIELQHTFYYTFVNEAGGLTYNITSSQILIEENNAGGNTYTIGE
jgi:hypothetical protein